MYLMRQSAADWLEAQPVTNVDTFDHFTDAFRNRVGPYELTKFRSAQKLFTRKQSPAESAEDFVAAVKKIGRRIEADEALLRYVIINGPRPSIAAHVIQQQPETMAEVFQATRVAELIAPPSESTQSFQLEIKRLADKLDRYTAAPVDYQSPRQRTPPPPTQRSVSSSIRQRQSPPHQSFNQRRVSFAPHAESEPSISTRSELSVSSIVLRLRTTGTSFTIMPKVR